VRCLLSSNCYVIDYDDSKTLIDFEYRDKHANILAPSIARTTRRSAIFSMRVYQHRTLSGVQLIRPCYVLLDSNFKYDRQRPQTMTL